MRVVLEIQTGPAAGHKVVLLAGQSVCVGQGPMNDFQVVDDRAMATTHCEFLNEMDGCCLLNRDGSVGTQLNGKIVDRAYLRDGDTVTAGATQILVKLEGGSDSLASVAGVAVSGGEKAVDSDGDVSFSIERTTSGLMRCRGSFGEVRPAQVAQRLLPSAPLFLTLHVRRWGAPLPPSVGNPAYLFEWLPEAAQSANSPVLFAADEAADWQQIVDGAWSQDVMLMIFSHLERDALLEHLAKMLRGSGRRGDSGMRGVCWPSTFSSLATMGNQTDFGRELLGGMDVVLIEDSEDPLTWQLFGGDDLPDRLRAWGWKEAQVS